MSQLSALLVDAIRRGHNGFIITTPTPASISIQLAVSLSSPSRCCLHVKSDLYIVDLTRTANRSSTRVLSALIHHALVGWHVPQSLMCSLTESAQHHLSCRHCTHLNLQFIVLGSVVQDFTALLQVHLCLFDSLTQPFMSTSGLFTICGALGIASVTLHSRNLICISDRDFRTETSDCSVSTLSAAVTAADDL